MTLELKPELEHNLEQIAFQSERSVADLAHEAVESYVAYQARIIAAVQEGRAAGERGDMLDHDEVMAMMDDIIENG